MIKSDRLIESKFKTRFAILIFPFQQGNEKSHAKKISITMKRFNILITSSYHVHKKWSIFARVIKRYFISSFFLSLSPLSISFTGIGLRTNLSFVLRPYENIATPPTSLIFTKMFASAIRTAARPLASRATKAGEYFRCAGVRGSADFERLHVGGEFSPIGGL